MFRVGAKIRIGKETGNTDIFFNWPELAHIYSAHLDQKWFTCMCNSNAILFFAVFES